MRSLTGSEFAKGQTILDQGKLEHLAQTEKKLYAKAAGSRGASYQTSITFDDQGKVLGKRGRRANCTCRAAWTRDFCKHATALLIAWSKTPDAFAVSETPAEEEAKTARAAKDDGKNGGKNGSAPKKRSKKKASAPKVDGNALKKQGAERVDTLVRELAVIGVGATSQQRVDQLQELAATLFQLQLRRLEERTLGLARLLSRDDAASHPVRVASTLANMLLTAVRIKAHCDGKTLEDRYITELVGKTWTKKDRKPVEGLELLEYAYDTRTNNKKHRICASRFIDLKSGEHYMELQILPDHIAKRTDPKPSHAGKVLDGVRGGLYPGFAPWRIHLEEHDRRRPVTAADLQRARAHATPIGATVAAFQAHRRDVFAPDRMPAFVRVAGLVAKGGRLLVFDEDGATLHLHPSPGLEQRMGDALEGCTLHGIFGEIDLEHAIPTLWPTRLLVQAPGGPALRAVGAARGGYAATEPRAWADVARQTGLSYAAVSVGEVREALAGLLVGGLTGLDRRATESLTERLRTLALGSLAERLDRLVAQPDPASRVGGFIKLFSVLEVAMVKLTGAAPLDRQGLVPVPTHGSIYIPEPGGQRTPSEAMTARLAGTLTRYEAAVHYHRYYRALTPEQIGHDHLVLADGAAAPYVIDAIAPRPELAVAVAESILALPMGMIALRTAFRLLGRTGSPEAELLLKSYSGRHRKAGKRFGQRVVHMADDALLVLQKDRPRLSPLAEARRDHLEYKLGPLLSQARSDKEAERRALGCEALAELGATEAIPELRALFRTDRAQKVREQAALSLAMLGDAQILEELLLAVRRRGPKDKSMAHTACRALGHLGDSRALPTMTELYLEGFTASVIADAWLRFGVLALDPIASMLDADPNLARRSALAAPLVHMPAPFVVDRLLARLRGAPRGSEQTIDLDDEAVARRAAAYLKLCTDNREARAALAQGLIEGHSGGATGAGKRVLASANKLRARPG
ncbi:MAG: HEAT repeat domain-containing protein [Myxococcota bacterium]